MTLSEFVKSFPRRERSEVRRWIANELRVSEVYVRSMCSGVKPVLAKYARKIEKITSGAVPKEITAPDYYAFLDDY